MSRELSLAGRNCAVPCAVAGIRANYSAPKIRITDSALRSPNLRQFPKLGKRAARRQQLLTGYWHPSSYIDLRSGRREPAENPDHQGLGRRRSDSRTGL